MSENILQNDGTIVISVCNHISSEEIIQKILGVETLPAALKQEKHLVAYIWQCETKYYSANVNLWTISDKLKLNPEFSSKIKAIVICFDSKDLKTFEKVLDWLPFLEDINAEAKLLLCEDGSSFDQQQEGNNILKWCVENNFELVELTPSSDKDEEDQTLQDAIGYERVIQALHSNTWESMILKGASKAKDATCSSNSTDNKQDETLKDKKAKTLVVGNEELTLEEKLLENVMKGDDPAGENFEALFRKFASIKEKAEGLTGDKKKKYAEEVAIAFWRAMGGDEDEIEGLDEED